MRQRELAVDLDRGDEREIRPLLVDARREVVLIRERIGEDSAGRRLRDPSGTAVADWFSLGSLRCRRGAAARKREHAQRTRRREGESAMKATGGMVIGLMAGLFVASAAWAEPTRITVRVLSRDAKFVGTTMGGAHVVIRDAQTGTVLAEGLTQGGTGDTERIMKRDRKRGVPISTEDAAKFEAVVELKEPRLLEIAAFGPVAQRQAAVRVASSQWVVPGKHLTGGDGWVLELPGLVVDVLAPPAHIAVAGVPRAVELRANVVMM
jgi:hypothetical protein